MDTDAELTSDSQSITRETNGSSELNAEEAEAITRSMDMSMAFWGCSENPPEKIPANRLKCPRQRTGKASSVAMKIWEKMTQQDLDKVKDIEVALLREGEIGTLDLVFTLKSIVEGTGLVFEEMLKSVNIDPLESTISLTNEILHIFNQNEPPEIVEEEEYASFIHFQPVNNRRTERQRRDISNKIKCLLNKAQKLGLTNIKVPSSPYLSERSKLSLIEKQIRSKLRLRSVERAFRPEEIAGPCSESKHGQPMTYPKKKFASAHQRRERCSLSERPKFRTAVKTERLRYEDMIKHAPDLSKRMKRVHEIRKKFMEKTKNIESKHTNNTYKIQNTRMHHYNNPYNFNNYNHPYKGKSPKKRYHLSSVGNYHISPFESEENVSNTKINITIESNESKKNDILPQTSRFHRPDRSPSREDVLLEMKKMLKEAVQEVAKSTTINHPCQLINENRIQKKEVKHKEVITENKVEENEGFDAVQTVVHSRSKDDTSILKAIENENKDDTVVTVTQESGIPPVRKGIVNISKDENKVSTEVKVCKSYCGPGLKVSVISKLSGLEADKEEQANLRNKQKNVQEAINILKEYIAINNSENILNVMESEECPKEQSLMINNKSSGEEMEQGESITSEAVTTTEIVIEPVSIEPENGVKEDNKEWEDEEEEIKSNEDSAIDRVQLEEESEVQTVQAYAVTMFMPLGAREELRPFNPFQAGSVLLNQQCSQWLAEDEGESGDHHWSFWSGPVWSSGLEDVFASGVRTESDSLFVNTSDEHLQLISAEGSSSFRSQLTPSSTSLLATGSSDGEEFRIEDSRTIMTQAVLRLYKLIVNSVLGIIAVIFKPFTYLKSPRPVKDGESDLSSSE